MLDERVYSISCWFITIHWQTVYCIALVALNFIDKMEFMYSCLHPKVYHEKISFYSWIYERNMCSSAACSCFFLLKACSWFLAHVFSYNLVYTTGGPPDFIVVLLIICYHWNLIRLFRTVLTETYDLRESYQCAIFIATVYFIVVLILHNFFLPSNYWFQCYIFLTLVWCCSRFATGMC